SCLDNDGVRLGDPIGGVAAKPDKQWGDVVAEGTVAERRLDEVGDDVDGFAPSCLHVGQRNNVGQRFGPDVLDYKTVAMNGSRVFEARRKRLVADGKPQMIR